PGRNRGRSPTVNAPVPITAFFARRKVLLVGLAVLLVGGLAGRVVLLDRGQAGTAVAGADSPKTKRGSDLLVPAANPTGQLPRGVTDSLAADGGVWVASSAGVQRIDPATNSIVARISLPQVGDSGMLAWADGSMWATQESGVLTRIDPLTNRAIATIALGGAP